MKKSIFLLEFRRTTLQFAVLTGAALAVLFVVQVAVQRTGGRSAADVREGVDVVVLILAAAAGLLVGVPTFCGEARRREIAFLEALPLDRAWIWALLVSSRIAASGLCFAIVVVLRPWLVAGGTASVLLLGAAATHFVLLAAGCCFGSASRKLPFAYAAAVATTALIVFETAIGIPDSVPDPSVMASRLVPLSAVFFGLSAWFVHRSELDLLRSRVRNLSAIAVAGVALVFGMQKPPPRYLEAQEGWMSLRGSVYAIATPRLGGGTRIAFFDTRAGTRLGTIAVPPVRRAAFAEDGALIWLLCKAHWPLRILDLAYPKRESVLAVRPDGTVVGPRASSFGEIESFQPVGRGRALLVAREGSQGTLVELDPIGRGARERMVAPLGAVAIFGRAGSEWLLSFVGNPAQPSRTWLVNDEVREVKATGGDYEWPGARSIDGTVFASPRAAATALSERLGVPHSEILAPGFRDAERGWILRTVGGDDRRCERIDVLPPGTTRWSPLDVEPSEPGAPYEILEADLDAGVLAFARRASAGFRIFVRDLKSGRGLEVSAGVQGSNRWNVRSHATNGGDRYVVTFESFRRGSDSTIELRRDIVVGDRKTGMLAMLPAVTEHGEWAETDVEGNTVVFDGARRVHRLHPAAGGVIELVP